MVILQNIHFSFIFVIIHYYHNCDALFDFIHKRESLHHLILHNKHENAAQ